MLDIVTVSHPLAQRELSILRDRETSSPVFRAALDRLTRILLIEATRDLPTTEREVETPLETTTAIEPRGSIWLCPVLRAGTGMLAPALDMIPEARVATIGLYRDEDSLEPQQYYLNLPPEPDTPEVAFVLDPMLATGGTAAATVQLLSKRARRIELITVMCAPEGIEKLESACPGIRVTTAAVDRQLNDKGYILPGLGDAGDRIFNTL